jgi:hypothetical protein
MHGVSGGPGKHICSLPACARSFFSTLGTLRNIIHVDWRFPICRPWDAGHAMAEKVHEAKVTPDQEHPTQIENVQYAVDSDIVLLDTEAAHLESGQLGNLKLAKDGHTVLIPQPTLDPNDPLNWSWKRKHMMLAIISITAFLGDYGGGAGIPLIVLQGEEWGLSPAKVNEAGNLNVLML